MSSLKPSPVASFDVAARSRPRIVTSPEEPSNTQFELGQVGHVVRRFVDPSAWENNVDNNDWELLPNLGDDEVNLLARPNPFSPQISPLVASSSSATVAPIASVTRSTRVVARAPSSVPRRRFDFATPPPAVARRSLESAAAPSTATLRRVLEPATAPRAVTSRDLVWSSSPFNRFVERNTSILRDPSSSSPRGLTLDPDTQRLRGLPSVPNLPACLSLDNKRKFQRWSHEEDHLLKMAVLEHGHPPINWKRIASKYFANARTGTQCKSRYAKALQPGIIRGPWTDEEDEKVVRLKDEGLKWSAIAEYLPGRIGEHVRDRYVNFLDPSLKRTTWTKEEDRILYAEQKRVGNKWAVIAKFLPGRSENMVKNRWHNAKMAQKRRLRRQAAEFSNEQKKARARDHAKKTTSKSSVAGVSEAKVDEPDNLENVANCDDDFLVEAPKSSG